MPLASAALSLCAPPVHVQVPVILPVDPVATVTFSRAAEPIVMSDPRATRRALEPPDRVSVCVDALALRIM